MSNIQKLNEILRVNSAQRRPSVAIEEISSHSNTAHTANNNKENSTNQLTDFQAFSKTNSPETTDERSSMSASTAESDSNSTKSGNAKNQKDDDQSESNQSETESRFSNSTQDHDILVDVEDSKNKMEMLGTVMSAFFQDDRGFNVVEAIIQNSKVQNKIAKTLEKILEKLDS